MAAASQRGTRAVHDTGLKAPWRADTFAAPAKGIRVFRVAARGDASFNGTLIQREGVSVALGKTMEPSESAKPMNCRDIPARGESRAGRTPRAAFSTIEGTGTAIEETAYDMNRSRLIEEAIAAFLGSDERVVHDSASHGL